MGCALYKPHYNSVYNMFAPFNSRVVTRQEGYCPPEDLNDRHSDTYNYRHGVGIVAQWESSAHILTHTS